MNRLLSELGREPTSEELAEASGLRLDQVLEAQLVSELGFSGITSR